MKPYTLAEIAFLRASLATMSDMQVALVLGRPVTGIAVKRRRLGLRKTPKSGSSGRNLIADEIRERARTSGWSLKALGKVVGTNRHLVGDGYLRRKGLNLRAAAQAVTLLGGELYAEWDD
ncbi:hypothetical protein [Devosia sp. CN2-171]|uniref:hypothetical protein n=1 Tax=Devosia sp. CN2-171 TaxID=3400909 RepID=UPI003BF88C16